MNDQQLLQQLQRVRQASAHTRPKVLLPVGCDVVACAGHLFGCGAQQRNAKREITLQQTGQMTHIRRMCVGKLPFAHQRDEMSDFFTLQPRYVRNVQRCIVIPQGVAQPLSIGVVQILPFACDGRFDGRGRKEPHKLLGLRRRWVAAIGQMIQAL